MKVLKFSEYGKEKENSQPEELNEIGGFLDAIVRFFKGMFDLFNDKKVKKEAEESNKNFMEIENDDEISDEELEEEIDVKRVRKVSETMNKNIKTRVETDEEKGIRTSKDLAASLASWLGMLFVYEESLNMPIVVKMTKNPELAKRFTVPAHEYAVGDLPLNDWYKQKECKPDPKVLKAFENVSKLEPDKKKDQVKQLAESLIQYVVKSKEENVKRFKAQEKEYLDELHAGLAAMAKGLIEAMYSVIKNTQDAKVSEVIATEIITKRKRKGTKKDTKPGEEKPEASKKPAAKTASKSSGETRSRKGTKKTVSTKTTQTT